MFRCLYVVFECENFNLRISHTHTILEQVEMFDRAPSFDARMSLLRFVNIRKRELFKLDGQHFEWGLLLFHRVAVLNSRTANELSQSLEDSDDRERSNVMRKPLSLEIEASALRSTMRYCRTFLVNHFATTEDEDLKLLNKDGLMMEFRQAVVYRVTKKRIVRNFLKVLQVMLDYVEALLSGDDDDSEVPKAALHERTKNLSNAYTFGRWTESLSRCPRNLLSK